MDDTRIRLAKALIDDAREVLTELSDELTNSHLEAARVSANVTIAHLNNLEAS